MAIPATCACGQAFSARDELASKLEAYANLLASIRDANSLQSNAEKIQTLAREVQSMQFDVQRINILATPTESQRLAAKYNSRMENASRRAKQEDDRVSRGAIQWQSDAILGRFKRPDFGTPPTSAPPGIPSPNVPRTPPTVPRPGFPR